MSANRTIENTNLELISIGIASSEDPYFPAPPQVEPINLGSSTTQLNQRLLETKQAEEKLDGQIVHYSDPAAQSCTTNEYTYFVRGFSFVGTALMTAAVAICGTNDWNYEDNISPGLAGPGAFFLLLAAGAKLMTMCEKRENRASGRFNPNEEYVIPVSEEDLSNINNLLPEASISDLSNGHRIIEAKSALSEQRTILNSKIHFFKDVDKAIDQLKSSEPTNSVHSLPTTVRQMILDYADPTLVASPSI